MATEEVKFQPKDYKSDQYVRWCPGCGDHAVLNCLHKAMAEVGVAPRYRCEDGSSGPKRLVDYRRRRLPGYRW